MLGKRVAHLTYEKEKLTSNSHEAYPVRSLRNSSCDLGAVLKSTVFYDVMRNL